jgi:apolipoprotein N-acyltransferase
MILLIYLMFSSTRFRQAFGRGYLTMLTFNAITLYWIGGWSNNDIYLKLGGTAVVLIHPFFFLVPLLIFYGVKKYTNPVISLFLFPFIWTGFEYSHNLGELAFPWIELGNSEAYNLHRIQYAQLAGVHGITFLICLISVILFYVLYNLINGKIKLFSKTVFVSFGVIVMLIVFPNIYSYNYLLNNANYDKYFTPEDSSKIIRTAVIQPNVNPFKKWEGNRDSLVDSYIVRLNESLSLNPDLIVLHETAVPYYFLEDYNISNTEKFIDFVNRNDKLLLMGIPHLEYFPDSIEAPADARVMSISKRKYGTYNSAILLEPGKSTDQYQIHEKVKLVPFSEHVPYSKYLPFLKKFIKWEVGISSWNEGDSLLIFKLKYKNIDTKFATLICFESVFSDYVSHGVKNGAQFLIIITNDGWWGNNGGPEQHKQFAVLRAIENRKWIIRAGQTGISCFIDPLGNIYDEIPYDTEGMIVKDIYANTDQTFYSIHGDVVGLISYIMEIFSLVLLIGMYIYRKRSNGSASLKQT